VLDCANSIELAQNTIQAKKRTDLMRASGSSDFPEMQILLGPGIAGGRMRQSSRAIVLRRNRSVKKFCGQALQVRD